MAPTRRLRGGSWNMLHNRNDATASTTAWRILEHNQLDFLALNEASEYLDDLRRIAQGNGGHVIGRGSTALIVAGGVKVARPENPQMTSRGWITVRGGRTGPKHASSAVLDGWLRVGVVHLPPSVWARGFGRSPIRRRAAYVAHIRSLRSWAKHRRRQLFIVGDWNATPRNRGPWSPRWLARTIGGRIIAPSRPTHGSRVIDFAVVRGVDAQARRLGKNGSDHHAVLFTIAELVRSR